jgi:hypothetical protein
MPSTRCRRQNRSQTFTTWLALLSGSLGLHRFYLCGLKDLIGWLFWPPTLIGIYGVWRMRELGMDDRLAWLLAPALGASLSVAMLSAIVYGLMTEERWCQLEPLSTQEEVPILEAPDPMVTKHQHNAPPWESSWLRVVGVIVALMLGSTVLITTIAFSAQRFYESSLQTL